MAQPISKMFRCELCSDDQHDSAAQAKRCCKGEEDWSGVVEIFWICDDCGEEFNSAALAKACKCN